MKFKPVSHSWVALHPQPKGVVQFIGGAFYGTFGSAFFYQHLLKFIYDQNYTIILLPFKFTFNHYREAGFLIREQYEVLPELIRLAKLEDYSYTTYLDNRNFYWLGHSIGCKYITLLEGFSALPDTSEEREKFIRNLLLKPPKPRDPAQIERVISEIELLIQDLQQRVAYTKQSIEALVHQEITLGDSVATLFIKGQSSVFLAPDNSDTRSAIQIKTLSKWLDDLGWGVSPTPEETNNLVADSNLFNRLGLIAFKADTTADETVATFINSLKKPPKNYYRLLQQGGHLYPLGVNLLNVVLNAFDIPYTWLRYIFQIDSKKPHNLAPFIQRSVERDFEFEKNVIDLYISLKNLENSP